MLWTIMDVTVAQETPFGSFDFNRICFPEKSRYIFPKKSVEYQTFGKVAKFYLLQNSRGQRKIQQGFQQKNRGEAITWANIWVFPKIVVPQNAWFIMENPIKVNDLGVPLLSETPIFRVRRPLLPFCGMASWCEVPVDVSAMTSASGKTPPSFWRLLWRFSKVRGLQGKKRQPNSQKVGCSFLNLGIWLWVFGENLESRQRCFFEIKVGYDDSLQDREIISGMFMAEFATRRWQKHMSNTRRQPVVNW